MDIRWKKLNEKPYKAGYRKMIERTYELPDGNESTYDVVDSGKAVCVLALTKENKVIVVKVFRPGPDKILIELPGGFLDEGLTPEEAINHELLEETGYTGDFELVGTSWEDAYSTMFRYHFIARNCTRKREPEQEYDEFMEIIEMELDDFKSHVATGELTDPETGYMGLNKLGLL